MVTISDVSRRAKVSTATVSRVLNHPDRVDESTRAEVLAAIAELRYRPNEVARGLASQSSRTVGIVINLFASPYYGQLLDGAVHALRELGFHALVESSGETADGEERALGSLIARQCDALIVHSDLLSDERLTELMEEHPNAVLMNRALEGFETRTVHLDNRRGGALVADHLVARGHRRLASITGPGGYFEASDRTGGFRDALARHGLALDPELEREGDFTERGGYVAMEALLGAGHDFSAVFCHNDEMAAGALDACRRFRLSVPRDLSIVGFDDIRIARYLTPRLSTVRQPLTEMGDASARLAHALASGKSGHGVDVPRVFRPEIVERDSVGPPPAPPGARRSRASTPTGGVTRR